MAAGSLTAHSLTYVFVSARASEGAGEVTERATGGGNCNAVLFLGILIAFSLVAAGLRLARRQRDLQVSPWLFFVLPPLAFASQEFVERLLHVEASPFQAVLEPRFLVGLLLQIPFGLLALFVARCLLRVVATVARALAPARTPRVGALVYRWRTGGCDLPRIPALALGHAGRGPPTS